MKPAYPTRGLELIIIVSAIFCLTITVSIAGNEKFYCLSETKLKQCAICCSGYGLEVLLPASEQRFGPAFENEPITCYCLPQIVVNKRN